MAQTVINVGTNANDGTGDDLRTAMVYINNNFTELYAASPITSTISIEGNKILSSAEGLHSRIIQHENDHLNGILFTDRISSLRRNDLKAKLDIIAVGEFESNYKMSFYKEDI